ncbi:MAG: cation transporter [Alphaproteobacteria bacterium]|nr:cation transporter [Alphaproteobacteria bacterium]
MRAPSAQELVQERIIRQVLAVDVAVIVAFLTVAAWSGSLTLGAEVLRGVILWCLSAMALWILVRVNRGRMAGFDFGTGKLERAVSVVIALAMVAGAALLGMGILDRFVTPPVRSSSGMAGAVAVALANFAINVWFLVKIDRASHGHVSPVVEAERRSLMAKVAGSGVVAATVTISAIFRASEAGNIADLVGTAFVAGFMIWTAGSMLREALPDLLDRSLGEDLQIEITRVLAEQFENYDGLIAVRSRQMGNRMVVEMELGFQPTMAIGVVEQLLRRIRAALEEALPGCRIVLIPKGTT